MQDINREIKLTLENTQELYSSALELTDFEPDNNQVSNLLAATLRQIRKNSGEDPYKLLTSFPEAKQIVVDTVRELQEESKK